MVIYSHNTCATIAPIYLQTGLHCMLKSWYQGEIRLELVSDYFYPLVACKVLCSTMNISQ